MKWIISSAGHAPPLPTADRSDPFSSVNAGVIPDHDDVSAEMAQQVTEEDAHLIVLDVQKIRPV